MSEIDSKERDKIDTKNPSILGSRESNNAQPCMCDTTGTTLAFNNVQKSTPPTKAPETATPTFAGQSRGVACLRRCQVCTKAQILFGTQG